MKKFLLAVIMTSTLISMGSGIFAYSNIASLDTIIQRAGQSIRPKDTFNELNKSIDVGNMYSSSYKLVQQEFSTTVLGTVSAMAGEINGKYNCDMTLNDIGNILVTISDINNDIQGALAVIQEHTSAQDSFAFANSCAKLIQCMGGKKQGSNVSSSSTTTKSAYNLSDGGFQTCKTYTTQVYNNKARILGSTVELTSTIQGNDMFYNGEASDAPFDILLDMQRIGDVLFSDNQQTDKTLFFTFPSNSIAGFQTLGFDDKTSNSTVTNPIGAGITIQGGSQATQSNSSQPDNQGTILQQNSDLPSKPNIPGGGYNTVIPITPSSEANTATVIDNYVCITPVTEPTTGSGPSNPIIRDNGNPNGYGFIYNDGSINRNPSQGTFNSNSPYYSPIVTSDDDPINGNWETPSDYEAQAATIKACTNKCEGLKAVDKAMCVAKCMCGTVYSKDGLFGLSVCTIPSTQTDVGGSKSVQSIEDIISEINNIFLALKNSGQMIKHTKTTEMFDTALSKIKLNKIFAFDININFKPVLTSKQNFQSSQKSQDETDNLMKGNYASIDIRNERNKYLTLYNPLEEEARRRGGTNLQAVQDNIASLNTEAELIKQSGLSTDKAIALAQSQNAEVADIVKTFLEQNVRFLTYLNDSLSNVQITADQFRQKIVNGK